MSDIVLFVVILGSVLLTFILIHLLMVLRPWGGRRR